MSEQVNPSATTEWELSKENVQPLKNGRKFSNLSAALTATPESSRLRDQKEAFELELRTYSGSDPLDAWHRYIGWVEQNYPCGGRKANLCTLLEKCVATFTNDERYTNDSRYIDMWIKFANNVSEPLEVYKYLHNRALGSQLAAFYQAWSWELESLGNAKMADTILQEGIARGAQPIDRLCKYHCEFQARVVRSAAAGDTVTDNVASQSETFSQMRSFLAALPVNRHGQIANDRASTGHSARFSTGGGMNGNAQPSLPHQQSRTRRTDGQGLPAVAEGLASTSNSAWHVFADSEGSGGSEAARQPPRGPLPPQSKEWASVPEAVRKENSQVAGPWNKVKVAQRAVAAADMSAQRQLPATTFAVHVDECLPPSTSATSSSSAKMQPPAANRMAGDGRNILSSHKVEAAANPIERLNNLRFEGNEDTENGVAEVVMYNKSKLYMGVGEFCFEELRAAKWKKRHRQRLEHEQQLLEHKRVFEACHEAAMAEHLALLNAELKRKEEEMERRCFEEFDRQQRDLAAKVEQLQQRELKRKEEEEEIRRQCLEELVRQQRDFEDKAMQQFDAKRPKLHENAVDVPMSGSQQSSPSNVTAAQRSASSWNSQLVPASTMTGTKNSTRDATPTAATDLTANAMTARPVAVLSTARPVSDTAPTMHPSSKLSLTTSSPISAACQQNMRGWYAGSIDSSRRGGLPGAADSSNLSVTVAATQPSVSEVVKQPKLFTVFEDVQSSASHQQAAGVSSVTAGWPLVCSAPRQSAFQVFQDIAPSHRKPAPVEVKALAQESPVCLPVDSDLQRVPELSDGKHRTTASLAFVCDALDKENCRPSADSAASAGVLREPVECRQALGSNEPGSVDSASKGGENMQELWAALASLQQQHMPQPALNAAAPNLLNLLPCQPVPLSAAVPSGLLELRNAFFSKGEDEEPMDGVETIHRDFTEELLCTSVSSFGLGGGYGGAFSTPFHPTAADTSAAGQLFAPPLTSTIRRMSVASAATNRLTSAAATQKGIGAPSTDQLAKGFSATGCAQSETKNLVVTSTDHTSHRLSPIVECSNSSNGSSHNGISSSDGTNHSSSNSNCITGSTMNVTLANHHNSKVSMSCSAICPTAAATGSLARIAPVESGTMPSDRFVASHLPPLSLRDPTHLQQKVLPLLVVSSECTATPLLREIALSEKVPSPLEDIAPLPAATAPLCDAEPSLREISCIERLMGANISEHEIDTTQYFPAEADARQAELLLNTSVVLTKGNPFDKKVSTKILSKLEPPLPTYAGYSKHSSDVPEFRVNHKVILGDCSYLLTRKAGEGGFAKAYVATCCDCVDGGTVDITAGWSGYGGDSGDLTSAECVCLKVQESHGGGGGEWEYYMCSEVQRRVTQRMQQTGSSSTDVRHSVMSVSKACFFDNGSVLANEFVPNGTLLNLVNRQMALGSRLPESCVMYLAIELLCIVEQLHACNIIHGDIKPDNLLLRGLFPLDQSDDRLCSRTKSLLLIDFGRSIDMTKFPPGTTFTATNSTSGFQCIEMDTGRPWTYQTDLFGLVGTIHVLLFGEYMKVYCSRDRWKVNSKFNRSWQVDLWSRLFDTLLNIPDCSSIPDLAPIRKDMETRFSNSELWTSYMQYVPRLNDLLKN